MWITNKSLNDPNEERQNWLYLALRRAIINCLLSFATKNKLQSHGKVCKNKIFCGIVMPSPKDNILQFIQYMKAIKCYTFIMLKLNLWLKNRWMCKQPRKIFSNKNVNLFLTDIQCQLYGLLILYVAMDRKEISRLLF